MADNKQFAEVFYGKLVNENNEALPVLYVGDEVSKSYMDYIQSEAVEYKSLDTKTSIAKALAIFVNWYNENNSPAISDYKNLKTTLREFYKQQRKQKGITKANINQDYVEQYIKHCYVELGYFDFFNVNELLVISNEDRVNSIKETKSISSKNKFLGHLDSKLIHSRNLRAFTEYQDDFPNRIVTRVKPEQYNVTQGIFPESLIIPMLFIGCRKSPNKPLPNNITLDNWNEYFHVRDQYLFIYYFFGGLRLSEPLHIFDGDVVVKQDKNNEGISTPILHAMLAHPEVAPYTYRGKTYKNRNDFLYEVTGMPSRTKRQGHYRARWKKLALDDAKLKCTFVYWICSQEFKNLSFVFHNLYRDWRRNKTKDVGFNPYLFVSDEGRELSVKAVQKRWERASKYVGEWIERIPLETKVELGVEDIEIFSGKRVDGQNIHSCRHGFKKRGEDLNLPEVVIQRSLHHKSKDSKDRYAKKSYASIQVMINGAEEKIAGRDYDNIYDGFKDIHVNDFTRAFKGYEESLDIEEVVKRITGRSE